MLDTIIVEVSLFPARMRLAIKELLVKRLERIAVLYQDSHTSDAKVSMPTIHANALASLKSSISRDRAVIAQRKGEAPQQAEKGEAPQQAEKPETVSGEAKKLNARPNQVSQSAKVIKPRPERDKRKSRRKSYMK